MYIISMQSKGAAITLSGSISHSKTGGRVQIKWYRHTHTGGSRYATCFHWVINGRQCGNRKAI